MRIQSPDKIVLGKKKEKEIKIFVDLDGVLTNWIKDATEICGIDLFDEEERQKLKDNNCLINEKIGYTDKFLWESIEKKGEDFWTNLESFSWTKRLIERCKKEKHFCLLTSPSQDPECASGKVKWINKELGKDFRDFLIGSPKYFCADENSILIDDMNKNIEAFEDAGGNGFLWPNSLSVEDGEVDIEETFKELDNLIKEIKNG